MYVNRYDILSQQSHVNDDSKFLPLGQQEVIKTVTVVRAQPLLPEKHVCRSLNHLIPKKWVDRHLSDSVGRLVWKE